MVAMIIVIITLLLTMAYFYLKCSPISAFTTFLAALISIIPAFNFFEPISNFIISKGYLMTFAPGLSFGLLFLITFAILKTVFETIAGANIDFGPAVKYASSITASIATAGIFAGVIIITITMSPLPRKIIYNRFEPEGRINTMAPKKSFLNSDGIVVGVFELISGGSMSKAKPKPFDKLNSNFLDKIHLAYHKVRDDVYPVTGPESIKIPKDGVSRMAKDDTFTIKAGLLAKNIKSGGARPPNAGISFMLAQARVTYEIRDEYKVVYPNGYVIKGKEPAEETSPEDVISLGSDQVEDGYAYCKLAYDIPQNAQNLVLQLKLNGQTEVPEIEQDPER